MEPLDPARNDGGSGFSKRRISSILKAPRKSIIFPDPVEQEKVVEPVKPVEKRNSRRVSFAPANDVLLFSNDVKNASPARNPLQDLIPTTAATQNRVQVAVTEDGIQQITGMDTLLNAPLHASQQKDKVNFGPRHDFGEKTIMFSTEEAFMDMTQSHTINIANDEELHADISPQNDDILPTSRDKTLMFSAEDGSMDMTLNQSVNLASGSASLPMSRSMDLRVEKKNMPSSVPCLDPDFENFLANLFKPKGSSVNSAVTLRAGETNSSLGQIKTQWSDVDKENQAPTSVSAVMGKSVNTSIKIGEPSYGGSFCPKDDVSMDMTETQTGHIIGTTGPEEPFQFIPTDLFPKAEMTSGKKNSEALGSSKRTGMETSLKPSLKTKVQRHQVKLDAEDDSREKTMRFTAEDAWMDVTRSHTVNIVTDLGLQLHQNLDVLPACGEKTVRFTAEDAGMDVTQSHTVNIVTDLAPQSYKNLDTLSTYGEKTMRFTANDAEMDVTRSHTVNISTGLDQQSHKNLDFLPACGDKTVRFSADDAAMDVTQSHTVNIVTDFNPKSHTNVDIIPTCGEKTVRFTADDAAMDVTQSHTVNIVTDLDPQLFKKLDTFSAYGEKTLRFTANDAAMDMTQSHTVNIATDFKRRSLKNVDFIPMGGEKTVRFTADDAAMDVTRSHTVNIATDLDLKSHQKVDIIPTCGEKTVRFTADDAAMDMTQSHTVNIATDFKRQSLKNVDFIPISGEKTVRFTADDAAMDVTRSHTVNIATDLDLKSHQNVDMIPTCGEKTVRFSADDAAMDMTQSHTANIIIDPKSRSHQNLDFLPASGEKTIKFTANDAAMDVTRSHTVNIATEFDLHSRRSLGILPACGEKTKRFTADDAAMDVTRSHTAKIITDFDPQSHQSLNTSPARGERTVRFPPDDAAMDVTRSHTVNIATDFEPQSHKNMAITPVCTEKTEKFPANDAGMDVTQSRTVNIARNSMCDSVLPHQDSKIPSANEEVDFPLFVRKRESETCRPSRSRSSSAHTLDPRFKNSLSKMSGSFANPVINKAAAPAALSPQETAATSGLLDQRKTKKPCVDTEKEATGFVPAVMENAVNETMAENDVSMDMTEAQTGHILGQIDTDVRPQCRSPTQDKYLNSDHLNKTEVTSRQSIGSLSSSNPDAAEITPCPDLLDSNETDNREKPEPSDQTCSPSGVDQDDDTASSQKLRRKSFADLHSKIRRLSHMVNTAPEIIAIESCTAPLPQPAQDKDKPKSLPVTEPELEMDLVNTEEDAPPLEEEQSSTTSTTPFNLKTKQLMSRLSVGGFKPKFPRRSKPDDPKKVNSVGEQTKGITANVTNQLSNFDGDVSDIYDEELGSCEDMSEILDTRSPQRAPEKVSPPKEFYMNEPLEDDVFDEDVISDVHLKKRPLPADENVTEGEKRMKASNEMATDFDVFHGVECDRDMTTASCMNTQTTDDSNSSHTATMNRCEATFESTFKQSLFESQLEDYANDMQRKVDDGTISVLEFFKLFNIDFVIHNPRQSVLPGRLLSDSDRTPMDLLKDRHINRPKQMVYQTDVQNLTEKVEGLKERMRDLDKPLAVVNGPLWEEMLNFSEKELKSLGAKLKERNNLFRKMSKVKSHEMKEELYSNLVQANLEEQQKLRGTIEEADQMIKSLDDCIRELETEVAAVEEKGFEDKLSLKSRQEEMQKVTEALANNEREMTELEMQNKQNSKKLSRLRAETRNLKSHITALHLVNEWRFAESKENCTVYTFLHETLHLQLVYEKSNGKGADHQPERKISQISFKHQLDVEKSQGHACLVHKLLSQYIEGEDSWVEKYPTSRHVPKLLHDVGLVVSRCRLVGEELRLLDMWGGLRLDILNISCVDTQVHIVFSSLKKLSKFEVIFSVSLIGHLCVFQVQSFKNVIGGTTIQQIEEIVASFCPGKNVLTKIIKKIHQSLLC